MTSSGIVVREVVSKADRGKFLQLPLDVFAGEENFVPQLFFERNEHISPKKNPFFEHADVQLFVAERGGQVVGRISAQVNHLHLERYNDATGQFGFLDAVDDRAVFKALLDKAASWLSERGMKRMQGPFSFSINEESGLLVDGYDTPPSIMMGHSLPYYKAHLEALGMSKAKDLIAYDFDLQLELPRAMQMMVRKTKKSKDITIRPASKKNLARDLDIIIEIFNDAWSQNWNFVPMTKEEVTAFGDALKILVSEDYVAIASYKGEPVAMSVTLPNINDWIRDLNGRLLPFGLFKLVWRLFLSPPKNVRMPLMGVKKEFHGTPVGSGLALLVIDQIMQDHKKRGVERGELSWVLEDNMPMRNVIEGLGGQPYKTYRIYEQAI